MSATKKFQPSEYLKGLVAKMGSRNREESMAAQRELAMALETPLRQGVLDGDILFNIFEPISIPPGPNSTIDYPLDFLAPGTEKEHIAYTIPNVGRIPERHVEGDYVRIPIFDVGSAIDTSKKYIRDAGWSVVAKMLEVLRYGFVKKQNDDGWATLIASGVDRNLVVYDTDAAPGQITKKLVSMAKTIFRRNSGGNSASPGRRRLTDLFASPEAVESIRDWGVDQVDEITRREIYVKDDNTINRVFGVNIHDLDELGVDQDYQLFYDNVLGASLPGGDVEILVGLNLANRDSFIMPVKEEVRVYEDDSFARQRRFGFWAEAEYGVACLDSREILLLSI